MCTGNTCRSPMAEAIFRKIVKERNIRGVICRSCGAAAYAVSYANEKAVRAMQKYGIDIIAHESSLFDRYIADVTDLFVCMEESYVRILRKIIPNNKTVLLGSGIPDPYGKGQQAYDECAQLLFDELNYLADALFCKIINMDDDAVKDIRAIEKECFSAPWTMADIRAELKNETAHFITAKINDKIIGYIGVHEVAGEAYIANIAVSEKYRGYGVASRLLNVAESGAKKRGCEFISLEVRKSNEKAISLSERRGYEVAGERKNFYTKPDEDGLIMTLNFK